MKETFGPRRRALIAFSFIAAAVVLALLIANGDADPAKWDAVAGVITAGVTAAAVVFAAAEYHITVRRDRQGRAFALLAELNAKDLNDALDYSMDLAQGADPEDVLNKLRTDRSAEKRVKHVLAHLEDIAIAIEEDHAEEQVLFRSLHRIVPRLWSGLRLFVLEERGMPECETLFVEFERMAESWAQSASMRDGTILSKRGEIQTLG